MDSLVSIIIPVYNVQDFLEQCLSSIVNQTYTKLEILIINDGSTDNSSLICQHYASQDSRIVFVSKGNEGVSIARNMGLALSTGEFVTFIDADDFIEPNYIETLISDMTNEIDLVCCTLPRKSKLRQKTIKEQQDMAKLFCEFGYVWGKLIRKSCIGTFFHSDIWH